MVGEVNNRTAAGMLGKRGYQQLLLCVRVACLHNVIQIRPMKTRDVLVWITQLELVNDVVAHSPRGARRERRDRALGKMELSRLNRR